MNNYRIIEAYDTKNAYEIQQQVGTYWVSLSNTQYNSIEKAKEYIKQLKYEETPIVVWTSST